MLLQYYRYHHFSCETRVFFLRFWYGSLWALVLLVNTPPSSSQSAAAPPGVTCPPVEQSDQATQHVRSALRSRRRCNCDSLRGRCVNYSSQSAVSAPPLAVCFTDWPQETGPISTRPPLNTHLGNNMKLKLLRKLSYKSWIISWMYFGGCLFLLHCDTLLQSALLPDHEGLKGNRASGGFWGSVRLKASRVWIKKQDRSDAEEPRRWGGDRYRSLPEQTWE